MTSHFDQKQRRKAEFITPPNKLKAKAGAGGLDEATMNKAEALIENNDVDFRPQAQSCLKDLSAAVTEAAKAERKGNPDHEKLIKALLFPALQMKSHGAMFHYPLITVIADKLVQFLEVIEKPDADARDVVMAFHTTIRAVISGQALQEGSAQARELLHALEAACVRYFHRYGIDRDEE